MSSPAILPFKAFNKNYYEAQGAIDLGGMRAVASDDVTSVAAPGNFATASRPLATVLTASRPSGADGPAAARTSVDIGSVVRGRFELESMIGEGGMGVVYRAVDRLHKEMQDRDPYVAIKILNSNLKRHPSALIALQRETRKAQILAHENIINVHSFDRDGAIVYMTMELLDGKSLRALIAENVSTGLPAAEATPMIRSMARALAYAHDNDIVHSDFKPGNVFLTRKQQIKVLDFGLARANPAAEPAGGGPLDSPALGGMTPAYASPDVLAGNEPTPADDVFALAIVAFELLTGRHPFDYERVDTARLPAVKSAPLPGLSRSQRKALLRAFEVEQGRRQKNAGEFLREFDGPTKTMRALQAAVAVAVLLPIAVFSLSERGGEPTIAFEDLAPEVRAEFERAVSEGQTALSFGAAGINDALLYFSNAYGLHPNNPRAVRGLETVADRFLASLPSADARTRSEVYGALYCNAYLRGYPPLTASCESLNGVAQCAAIAASCQTAAGERAR
jgi:serine/threonine protein kinase